MIGPRVTELREPAPTVALATSTVGIDAEGTVVRSDGVVLPLRPVRRSRFPGDRQLIQLLADGLTLRKSREA